MPAVCRKRAGSRSIAAAVRSNDVRRHGDGEGITEAAEDEGDRRGRVTEIARRHRGKQSDRDRMDGIEAGEAQPDVTAIVSEPPCPLKAGHSRGQRSCAKSKTEEQQRRARGESDHQPHAIDFEAAHAGEPDRQAGHSQVAATVNRHPSSQPRVRVCGRVSWCCVMIVSLRIYVITSSSPLDHSSSIQSSR